MDTPLRSSSLFHVITSVSMAGRGTCDSDEFIPPPPPSGMARRSEKDNNFFFMFLAVICFSRLGIHTQSKCSPHRTSIYILFCLSLSFCLCSFEVTVTSLHPPRLCRLAVFSIKPTFLFPLLPSSFTWPACVGWNLACRDDDPPSPAVSQPRDERPGPHLGQRGGFGSD